MFNWAVRRRKKGVSTALVPVLLACVWLLHRATTVVAAADMQQTLASSSYSCAQVYGLPTPADQCIYVKTTCIDTLNDAYSTWLLAVYFCNPPVVKVIVLIASLVLLLALFKGIGLTAERYFSVILSQISQDLSMPPRLAGCTLLALGNGAPDLSSSIEAISHGHYDLALGSLVGSVMFIGCVVAGRIISLRGRFEGDVRCNAAQVRDVLALGVAVGCVGGIAFLKREMTVGGVSLLLTLYAVYVILVLVADVTRRKYGVEWTGLLGLLSGTESEREALSEGGFGERLRQALLPHSSGEGSRREGRAGEGAEAGVSMWSYSSDVELVESPGSSRDASPRRTTWAPAVTGMTSRVKEPSGDVKIEFLNSAASAMSTALTSPFESTQEGDGTFENVEPVLRANTEQPQGGNRGEVRDHVVDQARPAPHIRPKYSQMSTSEYRARAFAAMSDVRSFHRAAPLPLDEAMSILDLEDMIEALVDREDVRERPLVDGNGLGGADPVTYTTTVFECQDRDEGTSGGEHHEQARQAHSIIRSVLEALNWLGDILVTPLAFLLKATIPVVANTTVATDDVHLGLDRSWLVRSSALSPFFVTAYVCGGILSITVPAACAAALAGAALGVAAWKAAKHPRVLHSVPVAALIGLYGFVISALWIGIIAEELVGIIHIFGVIGHIKPAVLGVTVLAWGNSLTDLMANIAIAMTAEGGVSMAMTACFAGPLFNLLLGLGIGFASYFSATGLSSQAIEVDIVSAIGVIFALVNCVGFVGLALWHKSKIPARVGWIMIGWYGIYMCLVVVVSMSSSEDMAS